MSCFWISESLTPISHKNSKHSSGRDKRSYIAASKIATILARRRTAIYIIRERSCTSGAQIRDLCERASGKGRASGKSQPGTKLDIPEIPDALEHVLWGDAAAAAGLWAKGSRRDSEGMDIEAFLEGLIGVSIFD